MLHCSVSSLLSSPPRTSSHPSTLTNHDPIALDIPTRSGSPTPSEIEEMNEPFINLNFRRYITLDFISQPKNIVIIVIIALTVAGGISIGVKHTQAEALFRPAAVWMKDAPGGWLIPVAILFIISFPPLFGHEVVAILCGDVWGLWIGFALVTLGSTLGEIGNF
ncbi:hypothetical protein SISNIDRAFT_456115 [Sistotremastrum niveocremeum HHB9708]|uniref:Uncharacterized protein n=1 Tax=Sistotremastrum niveocremeum HHB9708 TaxID=1314777 RepID=A0A164SZ12_9AGAM|nr:hypothetical protein SISNIDRAFT_456115 [Sistotremastrum niveocremeum HHB9708]